MGPVTLQVRHGGSGPPLLLLHGHPRTHVTWHRVALMRHLGHERFAVAGHDRGAYVACRLAMDHPAAVSHLAVLMRCLSARPGPGATPRGMG